MTDKELKHLIPEKQAEKLNERLTALGADEVSRGQESTVAAAEFHEHDAKLAAALVPVGTAAIGSILATSVGGEAGELTVVVALILGLVMFCLAAAINVDRRKNAVIARVINYRLEKDAPLAGAGTAATTGEATTRAQGDAVNAEAAHT